MTPIRAFSEGIISGVGKIFRQAVIATRTLAEWVRITMEDVYLLRPILHIQTSLRLIDSNQILIVV